MHNLKVGSYILSGRQNSKLKTISSLSDGSDGLLPKGKGEAMIYRSFAIVQTSKDYC